MSTPRARATSCRSVTVSQPYGPFLFDVTEPRVPHSYPAGESCSSHPRLHPLLYALTPGPSREHRPGRRRRTSQPDRIRKETARLVRMTTAQRRERCCRGTGREARSRRACQAQSSGRIPNFWVPETCGCRKLVRIADLRLCPSGAHGVMDHRCGAIHPNHAVADAQGTSRDRGGWTLWVPKTRAGVLSRRFARPNRIRRDAAHLPRARWSPLERADR
jgi:hypothetical protein